jgi:hypothetical protein
MNIRIGCSRLQSANHLAEFISSHSLLGNCKHLIRHDRSLYAAFPCARTLWRHLSDSFGCLRGRSLAEPDHNGADGASLAKVNMGLGNTSDSRPE